MMKLRCAQFGDVLRPLFAEVVRRDYICSGSSYNLSGVTAALLANHIGDAVAHFNSHRFFCKIALRVNLLYRALELADVGTDFRQDRKTSSGMFIPIALCSA